MIKERRELDNIPVIVWGEKSNKAYIFVHGKMSNKESAETFAEIAASKGYQTISFDLPEHGERVDKEYKCNITNGVKDLKKIGDYVFINWKEVSLFGCSLGAYFSLNAYSDKTIKNCLFLSPIVDMEFLIHQMFTWFNITEEQLREKVEIPTPIDTMSWSYYQFVKNHPIDRWTAPTCILYGAKDNLQSFHVMEEFKRKFNCELTISENSEHSFMDESDKAIVEVWLKNHVGKNQ